MSDERFKQLLNNPIPFRPRVLLIQTAESGMITNEPVLPTGIAILAAICRKKNVPVRCVDYSVTSYREEELKSLIEDSEIGVVGISSTTPGINQAYRIARAVKEMDGRILTLMGGPHASVLYEEALSRGADIVVRNEGELTFLELLPLLAECSPGELPARLKGVRGIAYRNCRGQVEVAPENERIDDLDLIPFPDRGLFGFPEKYHNAIRLRPGNSFSVIGSRGCPENCFFCSRAVFGHTVTTRSPENIVEEIRLVKETYPRVTQFEFLDDNLLFDLERMRRICDLLIEGRINLPWSGGNTRVDNIDEPVLKKMKESGCFKLNFGIEAGSDRVLKSINKRITIDQAREAIELTKKAGLFAGIFFILGHHTETVEDVKHTIRLARTFPADAVQFTINTPWPGTALYRFLEGKGWLLSKNWDDYGYFSRPVFRTEKLDPEVLNRLLRRAYLAYYSSPLIYLRHLKNLAVNRQFYLYFTTLLLIVSNLFRGRFRYRRNQ